jgi:hypothetical protein
MREIKVRSQERARQYSILHSVQISLCSTDAVQWELGAFSPEVKRRMKLRTHLYILPRIGMWRGIPSLTISVYRIPL